MAILQERNQYQLSMSLYKIIQFQGAKNSDTKKINGGYLFIEAIGNIEYKGQYSDWETLNNGIRVGLSIQYATNRKEAIKYLCDNYQFRVTN